MIQEFVDRFMAKEEELKETLRKNPRWSYKDLVKETISLISEGYRSPDPERITIIDHGDFQGTLLFVIAAQGYQPYHYWYVKISYGSCSGCDTLIGINELADYDSKEATDQQVKDYYTLCLHIIQQLKEMD